MRCGPSRYRQAVYGGDIGVALNAEQMTSMRRVFPAFCAVLLCLCLWPAHADTDWHKMVADGLTAHPRLSGAFVLEKGEDSLLARAWLADHAQHSIDVQYFIWSSDNIGILAAESLLRAAERGVRVRVIVDDLLVDASDKSLVALARHPNIEIKIYNPKHTVGMSLIGRLINIATDFRGSNQRMHNKTFMVDGLAGITGGRNMADEYFDYDEEYNFRDRDILLFGPVVGVMESSFESYWNSALSVSVGELLQATDFWLSEQQAREMYRQLHAYAAAPENFEPQVRAAISSLPGQFEAIVNAMIWSNVRYISDAPGKNAHTFSLQGGGRASKTLADLARTARSRVTIQTPYLVLSEEGEALFSELRKRGVTIRISTNSLAATDNLPAFSGYAKQRARLLEMGLEIFEFKPHPEIRESIMQRYPRLKRNNPLFALHAKSMVVDGESVYIGTYNLDPRSENLNTEAGVIAHNARLAQQVEAHIERDMAAGNSWHANVKHGDSQAGLLKRGKVRFWKVLPLKPLL